MVRALLRSELMKLEMVSLKLFYWENKHSGSHGTQPNGRWCNGLEQQHSADDTEQDKSHARRNREQRRGRWSSRCQSIQEDTLLRSWGNAGFEGVV